MTLQHLSRMVLGSRETLFFKLLTVSWLRTELFITLAAELEMWGDNSDWLLDPHLAHGAEQLTEYKETSNSRNFQIPLDFYIPSLILLDVTVCILRYELYPHRYHLQSLNFLHIYCTSILKPGGQKKILQRKSISSCSRLSLVLLEKEGTES